MHRTKTARSIALPRRPEGVQPMAILNTFGMIAALLLVWAGLVL